jgi:DNA-directed RNA polymerase specialized sigma24 family protein
LPSVIQLIELIDQNVNARLQVIYGIGGGSILDPVLIGSGRPASPSPPPRPQQEAIEKPAAWLTTVTSRICLDLLGSARARRETYVGAWLAEPVPGPAEWRGGRPGADGDPAGRITPDESVSMAFLVVLETMTPAERVAFIMHDVFRHSFAEVAEMTGRTPAACRKLASAARHRVLASRAPAAPPAREART